MADLSYDLTVEFFDTRNLENSEELYELMWTCGRISTETLRKLIDDNRFDIIDWLPTGILMFPTSISQLSKLILGSSETNLRSIIQAIDRNIHSVPKLHSILRCLFSRLESSPKEEKILTAITTILTEQCFWGQTVDSSQQAVGFLRKQLLKTSSAVNRLLLIGKGEPTWIEEVFLSDCTSRLSSLDRRLNIIEFLLLAEGVEIIYAKDAFLAHSSYIFDHASDTARLPTGSIGKFFAAVVDYIGADIYQWFIEKLAPYLDSSVYATIYELGLLDYIILTESLVPPLNNEAGGSRVPRLNALVQICLTTSLSRIAEPEDIVRYATWLVDTGRVRQLTSKCAVTLIKRLIWTANSPKTAEAVLHCYRLSDPVRFATFVRDLLIKCNDAWVYSESEVIVLLDLMADVGLSMSEAAVKFLAESTNWAMLKHIISNKEKINPVRSIIGIITRFSKCKEILQLINFQFDSSYYVTIFNFLVEHQVFSEELLTLILREPEITRTVLRSCPTELCEILPRTDSFTHSANLTLSDIISTLAYQPFQNRSDDYDRCAWIIERLDDKAWLFTRDLVDCFFWSQGSLNLITVFMNQLKSRIQCPRTDYDALIELGGKCLKGLISSTFSDAVIRGMLADYSDFIDEQVVPLLFTYDWSSLKIEEQLIKYVQKHEAEYLQAVFIEFAKGKLGNLPALCKLSKHVMTIGTKLHVGKRIFSRAVPMLTPDDVILYEEQSVDRATCQSCMETLIKYIYSDSRLTYGKYYCKQCADSITDQSFISLVPCGICTEDKDELVILDCRHIFCISCIESMFKHNINKCPTCRKNTFGQKVLHASEITSLNL